MYTSLFHNRWCKAAPEAELPKAFSALLMSPKQGAVCCRQRDAACELDKSEFCSIRAVANEPQHLQNGPAAGVPHLPGAQEATWHKHGDATCECAVSADVKNGFCTRNGNVRDPLGPQGTSATKNEHKRNLRRFLGECRASPVASRVGTVSPPKGRAGRCVAVSRCLEEAWCSAGPHQWLEARAPAAPKAVQFSCCCLCPQLCPWLWPQLCPCLWPGSWLSGCQLSEAHTGSGLPALLPGHGLSRLQARLCFWQPAALSCSR